ncbi:succinate dehydrogenase/fumarate reductase iron-sulfur subunit [Aetokthonos hydrillicola Thurmond2011]|jgi:succinate dehydrogenase / fumarate reductase iron-sulfur subunit|uniref:succinate dehydrogenase n=1 Tax=Aetokthonos hydrillicola Thurmond2011 TaxID=2712845 RepID=A0AAP5I2S3_9CYAN|nr:succinate dehydrogenase/fumarate reductase iron-sulfur subunit [Aetokthonos hydrillicola]MBO3462309.1 succinate dehydrogenase/fumarate reductase iron-sulfur subunit [Aetokthonos hydrillicola CCALA 1050]MBW4590820.1 succinate dehydrogenase/fumarate reductase iron-sulfur subunit [Aetokthonos hydrillicola CCALA 1050]MDR9893635.1 succinate dehydrogenase/fumarate reductase iron-sulfur subunit [Aetokthonos hydrillicola Thurmond2011]
MEVLFKVIRQKQNSSPPEVQTYVLDVEGESTILDCLNRIKWEQDGTLAFRKNCRNTICGSCAVRINGRSALACKENVNSEIAKSEKLPISGSETNVIPEITVAPLGNMPVIKDLVVDMSSFWNNLEKVAPYVSTAGRKVPEREFLQTPEERSRLDQTGNCIMCGACYSECNGFTVEPEFVGPHALAKAYRMVADSRDSETENRLENYNEGTKGVWGCTRCFWCNSVCPMEVAPLDQITKIKQEILAHKEVADSVPLRHRKGLVEIVKQGGWINESQFALQVVGNYFRDIKGLLSILPLGLRMIARGKFPMSFEASEGTQQVRSLIDAVKQETGSKRIKN